MRLTFWQNIYNTWMQASSNQVFAITEMPPPTCKKQVQSSIGIFNYLLKFSTRLSELVEPIRESSKGKVPFNWGPEHQDAFEMMKREIAKSPVLAYYNPKKQTVLQTDASIKGLACYKKSDQFILLVKL